MSEVHSVLDAQVETLLELVERHRSERCTQLLEQAQERRHTLLAQTYGEARTRMHEAIVTERRRGNEKLDATRAQLQTRARQQQHRTALLLLQQGWELLGQSVLQRWKTAAQRRLWVCNLLHQALQRLPRCAWVIEHPPGWDSAECSEQLEVIRRHCGVEPQLRTDDQLHAGLRVCADGACLDGTLEGLLADRDAIEAQLLAQLHRLLNADQSRTEVTP
ncbi:MAG: hypothetical protein CVV05_06380 [Gammaproteobacteria bacterium HGW-Gammaproteobacteria-1]|jgi:hypothetical protein|nr:MAG: hypothetical protein CVV05_06380 [Gammaproteobacteria bacterium HGW-Gammaproteobacteria-1]